MIDEEDDFSPITIDRERCPLISARKDRDFGTEEVYNPDNVEHVSEWTMAMALASYKQGEVVPFEEFHRMTLSFKRQQMLIDMEERGIMESYWDGKGVAYRVTVKGMQAYEERKRSQA